MNTKFFGVQIDEEILEDFQNYKRELSEERKRKVTNQELVQELIIERLKRDFWITQD